MKMECHFIQSDQLQKLLDNLLANGYVCIGPQVRDGAIIYDEINSTKQLPRGVTDTQAPGSYTLNNNSSDKYFDWANGPQAIKPLLFASRESLWQSEQSVNGQISFITTEPILKPIAIIGVRACDIAAMKIQDQHFLQQQFVDPYYKIRRDNLLTVAVNCGCPAEMCFCHSTGDGPFVDDGADVVMTELDSGFLISAHSSQGEKLLKGLTLQPVTQRQIEESETIRIKSSKQNKNLPHYDIKSRLFNALRDEFWHEIATKCLSCGNCTAVCPTCFCHNETDVAELDGKSSIHYRQWDSCFSQGHSYIHGITIRSETSQRYRQWLTHKFSSWHEQYGRSGCVGCGRCIAWCPVGIDVTESLANFEDRRRG
ncbi:MAG: 4Fe-4S dicluster domain-containing protein [Gammaproteobacteria bacterium]|nr:4Fe-4S dicluster domain-containing protein [Gammaproteobacteria bacterium]